MTAKDQDGLTPRQRQFVDEYLLDANATQAAVRAGYSQNTVRKNIPRLLATPNIARAIETAQARRSIRLQVTQDDVVRSLLRQSEYEDEGASHHARVRALELLGKHLGMFVERPASDNSTKVAIVIRREYDTVR